MTKIALAIVDQIRKIDLLRPLFLDETYYKCQVIDLIA